MLSAAAAKRIGRRGFQPHPRVSEYLNATEFTHDWANLSGWTTTGVQASSNRLYGISGGNPAATAQAFAATASETVKVTAEIVVNGTNSGAQYVGLNFGGSNLGVNASLPNFVGIGIGTASRFPHRFVGASFTGVTTGGVTMASVTLSGTYRATVVADAQSISITLQKQDGTVEYSEIIPRSAAPNSGAITSIIVWNGSTNGTSGHYVMAIGAKKGLTPFRTKTNAAGTIEGNTDFVLHRNNGSDNWRVQLPAVMNGMAPLPVAVFFHQATTGNRNNPMTEARWTSLRQALMTAGYALLSADDGGDKWGNAASLSNYAALVKWVQDRVYTGKVYLIGCSMGGLPTFNTIKHKTMYPIAAAQVIGPVCDLVAMRANATFTASIDAAWGSSSDATLIANSAGYNPIAQAPSSFRRVPYRFNVGDPDTIVPPAAHSYLMEPVVQPVAVSTELNVIGTGHLQTAQYDAANIIAFFNAHR